MSPLTIILLTLIASAFSSGAEIAFLSANKLRIELDRKQGSFPARILWNLVKSPSQFIATMLLANNVALVIYGIAMSDEILTPDFLKTFLPFALHTKAGILITQTFISTLIILVAAEFIPKAIFRLNPNGILKFISLPLQVVYYFLYPVVAVVMWLSKFILKNILRVKFIEERPVFGRVDLDLYISDLTSKNPQAEERRSDMQIFKNALGFTEVKVRECMVPRTEIISIALEEPVENLRKLFIETRLSRILVYRLTPDNIIGFVHSSEMFNQPETISDVLIPTVLVPEVMQASELLTLFINQHKSMAVVVDEFGSVSGVVTMEDVMEEIFGEIQDEHDESDLTEKKISATEFIFSARMEIDILNRRYHLNIPVGENYETLGGYIMHHHENIPEVNEKIIVPPFTFTVLQVKDNRIGQVRLKVN
jgi:putative hemolysin